MRLNEISKEQKIHEAICNDKLLAALYKEKENVYLRTPVSGFLDKDGNFKSIENTNPILIQIDKLITDRIFEIKNFFD